MLRDSLRKLDAELGKSMKAEVRIHQLDITNLFSINKFFEHLKAEHGGFDVLVNNAGIRFNVSFVSIFLSS